MTARLMGWAFGLIVAAVLLGPLAVLAVDGWCWLMLGASCTPVPWDSGRAAIAIMLPVAAGMLASAFGG